jgi:hypothetical protein
VIDVGVGVPLFFFRGASIAVTKLRLCGDGIHNSGEHCGFGASTTVITAVPVMRHRVR